MSTHCFIGIELKDKQILGIYVHYDGYPEYAGALLVDHYTTPDKIFRLMALGNLRMLGIDTAKAEEKILDPGYSKGCEAYIRDTGSSIKQDSATLFPNRKVFFDNTVEYSYLWVKNSWVGYKNNRKIKIKKKSK